MADLGNTTINGDLNVSGNIINSTKNYASLRWDNLRLNTNSNAEKSITIKNMTGRPFFLSFCANMNPLQDGSCWTRIRLYRNDTQLCHTKSQNDAKSSHNTPLILNYLDTGVSKGSTYTYKFRVEYYEVGSCSYAEDDVQESPQIMIFEI